MEQRTILFTGGSGLLGSTFKKIAPDILYPTHEEFDVTSYETIREYAKRHQICVCVHAAAFTSPPLINKDPERALMTNIVGTSFITRLCMEMGARLIYISTDYVFRGSRGMYTENDDVHPVNTYAWSKLGGECAVRLYDNSLIIRTSFGPDIFPYEKAFVDQWTSREPVSIIAQKIFSLIDSGIRGIIHVGGKRQTVFKYAQSSGAYNVGKLTRNGVSFSVPIDTSLDCSKFEQII